MVFGRSLGSGPATYLSSHRKVGLLILFSAYRSIQEVAMDHAWIFGRLIKQCFINEEYIKKVRAPTFFVHGKMDEIIKIEHSVCLFSICPSRKKKLVTPDNMTHNKFSTHRDFLEPLLDFVEEVEDMEFLKSSKRKISCDLKYDVLILGVSEKEYWLPLLFLLEKYRKTPNGKILPDKDTFSTNEHFEFKKNLI